MAVNAVPKWCGDSQTDLTKFNPQANFCKTLVPGQKVCWSSGTLPDPLPPANSDGICKTISAVDGDACGCLASKSGPASADFTMLHCDSKFCLSLYKSDSGCVAVEISLRIKRQLRPFEGPTLRPRTLNAIVSYCQATGSVLNETLPHLCRNKLQALYTCKLRGLYITFLPWGHLFPCGPGAWLLLILRRPTRIGSLWGNRILPKCH